MQNTFDQITKHIPKEDRENPTTIFLLEMFEQQFEVTQALKEQNQILRDEIARLKGQKPKPKIKPSKLAKDANKKSSPKRLNPKSIRCQLNYLFTTITRIKFLFFNN